MLSRFTSSALSIVAAVTTLAANVVMVKAACCPGIGVVAIAAIAGKLDMVARQVF